MDALNEVEILHELRCSPAVFARLADVRGSELHVQKELRREFPPEVVRAAIELRELRARAAAKFTRADAMWLERTALEQATAEAVARHKARRFSDTVHDYCCGIGGDAIALAEHCNVIAVDRSPAMCLRAQWNAEVYGVGGRVHAVCADVEALPKPRGFVHIDPDRRPGGRSRTIRVEESVPGLDFLRDLGDHARGTAIKLSPAANFGGKFPGAEIELISLGGEAKEATIWLGELATPDLWRATVLPSGESLAGYALEAAAPIEPLGAYLYDPDPAIVRAGLVDVLAEKLGLWRLDGSEEYLSSDSCVDSPFVRVFRVLADLPNNDREIRRWFRESDFGQVEIKCRHIPIDADAVRRKLPLPGRSPGTLIFARVDGKTRAIASERLSSTR